MKLKIATTQDLRINSYVFLEHESMTVAIRGKYVVLFLPYRIAETNSFFYSLLALNTDATCIEVTYFCFSHFSR